MPLDGKDKRPFGETLLRIGDVTEFSPVPPGRYRLTLQADSLDGAFGSFLPPWVEEVDLQAGERHTVVIQAQIGGRLLVSGPPEESGSMELLDSQRQTVRVLTNLYSQGYSGPSMAGSANIGVLVPRFDHLTPPLPPGEYVLEVQHPSIAQRIRSHNLTIRTGEVTRINPFQ